MSEQQPITPVADDAHATTAQLHQRAAADYAAAATTRQIMNQQAARHRT